MRRIHSVVYAASVLGLVGALYFGSRGNGSSNPSYADERVAFSTFEVDQVADGKVGGESGVGSKDLKIGQLILERKFYDSQRGIVGRLTLDENLDGIAGKGEFGVDTIELPWRNNLPNVSAVPVGNPYVRIRNEGGLYKKYGPHLLISNRVGGISYGPEDNLRLYIGLHGIGRDDRILRANMLKGCIGVGEVTGDGYSLRNTAYAQKALVETLRKRDYQEVKLVIRDKRQ